MPPQQTTPPIVRVDARVITENDFIHRVYAWMGLGLFITAVVSFIVISNQAILDVVVGNTLVFFGLLIAEVFAVVYLSARVQKMSVTQAGIVFVTYSALNGLTLSAIFLVYTASSIGAVFVVTAGMFAAISIYGFITKKDLTSIGNLAFMALVGLILASVVNLFLQNDGFYLILSYLGVIIFTALTAYDTQKLKKLNQSITIGSEEEKKYSIIGALTLYLDFINLFIDLLRIMGKRR